MQAKTTRTIEDIPQEDEHNNGARWRAFAKKWRRLIRDGIRLRRRPDFTTDEYRSRVRLLDKRLTALTNEEPVAGVCVV